MQTLTAASTAMTMIAANTKGTERTRMNRIVHRLASHLHPVLTRGVERTSLTLERAYYGGTVECLVCSPISSPLPFANRHLAAGVLCT